MILESFPDFRGIIKDGDPTARKALEKAVCVIMCYTHTCATDNNFRCQMLLGKREAMMLAVYEMKDCHTPQL
jgi:hypothetical protein